MRHVLVWLACLGILFPADLGVHILQTPVMWTHYIEYLETHEAIAFTDFLDIHTSEEAHKQPDHDKQESEFPCHHHHQVMQMGTAVFVFQQSEFTLSLPAISGTTQEFAEIHPDVRSSMSERVWNPPRFI